MAAVWYYDLDLYSDFTYYLVDYSKEDQFNQQDRRWVGYLDAHHTVFSTWLGRKMSNTFGVQYRNDWINNGLTGRKIACARPKLIIPPPLGTAAAPVSSPPPAPIFQTPAFFPPASTPPTPISLFLYFATSLAFTNNAAPPPL